MTLNDVKDCGAKVMEFPSLLEEHILKQLLIDVNREGNCVAGDISSMDMLKQVNTRIHTLRQNTHKHILTGHVEPTNPRALYATRREYE